MLEETNKIPCVFLRDDDVWEMDSSFSFFFQAALEEKIPVVYGVIPSRLDKSCAEKLIFQKKKDSSLLDIVQHGWSHENHSSEASEKYEFGFGRSYDVQCADIKRGFARMQTIFGNAFTPVFVPPYHGYDERTLKAVGSAGFSGFSAASPVSGLYNDFPARVALNDYKQGGVAALPASEMLRRVLLGGEPKGLTGVVVHHAAFSDKLQRRELRKFLHMLSRLHTTGRVRLVLLSDILKIRG